MRKIIVAVNPQGIIGVNNQIPWHYPEDLRRFKRLTKNNVVIMGRRTWESLPKRPLKGRVNIVITSRELEDCIALKSISESLDHIKTYEESGKDVYFIGGARIYDEALKFVDEVDITRIPDLIELKNKKQVAYFDLDAVKNNFKEDSVEDLFAESKIKTVLYKRK